MSKKIKVQLHFSAYEAFGELSNFVYDTKLQVIPRVGETLFVEIENEILSCEVHQVIYNISLKSKKSRQDIILELIPLSENKIEEKV